MIGFAKAELMGNVTRDPELRTTTNGKSVLGFDVAVNSSKGSQTDYFPCVAFDQAADTLGKYLNKGKPVYVSGKLSTREYEKDGQRRKITELIVREFVFLGPTQEADRPLKQHEVFAEARRQDNVVEDIDDRPIDLSEIPF